MLRASDKRLFTSGQVKDVFGGRLGGFADALPGHVDGALPPVAGAIAWYDVADLATLTLSAGTVTAIADKSGGGLNATSGTRMTLTRQPSAPYRRVLGLCGTTVAASGFSTSVSSSDQTSSAFFVCCPNGLPAAGQIMARGVPTTGGIDFYINSSGQLVIDKVGIANMGTTAATVTLGQLAVFGYSLGVGTVTQYINTTAETDSHAQTLTAAKTASLVPAIAGWFGEAIFYDTQLSSGDALTTVGYLMSKWGIA